LFFVNLGNEVRKIRKYYIIFVYVFQNWQDGKKTQKEIHETKVTKIPKTKKRQYGMTETYIKTFLKLQDSQPNDFQSLFNQNAVIYRLANDKQIVVTLVTLAMIS
jgi:hypothetical protein